MDGETLLWVGTDVSVRMDSPRIAGGRYDADNGASTEIFTQGNDSTPYIELEMLGPVADLAIGDPIERAITYTLHRRTETDPESEARSVLGLAPR